MSAELCHLGLIEIGCLLDASWLQTSAWATTAIPRRRRTAPPTPTPVGHETFDAAVRHATDRLPLDQAHALWLVDVCGLTYAEAAAETGITPKRFAKRLHTARTTIRKAVT